MKLSAHLTPVRWKWIALGGVLVLLLILAGVGYWLATAGLRQALESQKLRVEVGQQTGVVLNARSGYLPFSVQGDTVRSEALLARGTPPSPLTELEADDLEVRGRWLAGLLRGALRLEVLRVAHVRAAYGPAGMKLLPPGSSLPAPVLESPVNTPDKIRVIIDRISVAQADVAWGSTEATAGGILGTQVECVSEGAGALRATLTGGVFRLGGWPTLPLETARVRFVRPDLHVEEAKLRLPVTASQSGSSQAGGKQKQPADDGQVTVAGEVRFAGDTPLEARLKFTRCPVGPMLPERWAKRLSGGRFDGEIKIQRPLRDENVSAQYAGSADASDATLREMPMLDQIALITGRDDFRRLHLRQVRGEFNWDGKNLLVRHFLVEAGQGKLLRVEGEFAVDNKRIDGTFQVGVTPGVIASIPGARERVFTEWRDGYSWTPLRVAGPLDHPQEDLRERLVKAAEADLAGKFLGPVLGPGKAILKLLQELDDVVE